MPRRLTAAALLLLAALAGGCGTVCSLAGRGEGDRAYGGVRFDLAQVEQTASGNVGPVSSDACADPGGTLALAAVAVIFPFLDLPLSFVGDTLTYPLARWLDRR